MYSGNLVSDLPFRRQQRCGDTQRCILQRSAQKGTNTTFFSFFFLYQRVFDYFFISASDSAASSADVLHVHRSTFTRLLRCTLTHWLYAVANKHTNMVKDRGVHILLTTCRRLNRDFASEKETCLQQWACRVKMTVHLCWVWLQFCFLTPDRVWFWRFPRTGRV